MLKLNTSGKTLGELFGITRQREDELIDLLQAAGNACMKAIRDEVRQNNMFCFKSQTVLEVYLQYATNQQEEAFCLYHAAQTNYYIEKQLESNCSFKI